LRTALRALSPAWRVRLNYPYHGASDGLTTSLRRTFGPRYLGVEIELNQALLGSAPAQRAVARHVGHALARVAGEVIPKRDPP
jgi:predicted N-formylglutamate amidohydrolase